METERNKIVVRYNVENNEVKFIKPINKIFDDYLNDWIDKENFDDISSIVTVSSSVNDDSTDNENLLSDEYIRNFKIDDCDCDIIKDINNGTKNFIQDENLLKDTIHCVNNYLSNQNLLNYNHGNISITNANNIHIGNVVNLTGPIQIIQTSSSNNCYQNTNQWKQLFTSQNNTTHTSEINASAEERKSTKNYLIDNECVQTTDELKIVDRKTWVAKIPLEEYERTNGPVPYVIIAHTVTKLPLTQAESIYLVRSIQSYHIESKKYNDIYYNFLIGGEGNVYEGRGWGVVGSHTLKYNQKSLGIAFIGYFMEELPPKVSLDACKLLIKRGVELNYIQKDYKLFGHCQLRPFLSPGKKLFEEIQTWPHFSVTL